MNIVLCKDCKHKRVRSLDRKMFCWRTAYEVRPDDFCSRGVRDDITCVDCKHYEYGRCEKLKSKTREDFSCTWAERRKI